MENQQHENEFMNPHEPAAPSSETKSNLPFLTLNLFPGFKCFFKENTQKQHVPYHQCYRRVMQSHFELQKIRMPLQQVIKNKSLSLMQKSRIIYSRTSVGERNYIQSEDTEIVKYNLADDKQKKMEELNQQLELYRRSAEEALLQKREQFRRAREQQQRVRMRLEQEKKRRAEVIQQLSVQYAEKEFKRKIDTDVNIKL